MPDFDLFVIGGGSGGVACARRAASHGARVGLAEHSRVGGTCVIRGCVPKKLMNYGAHFAEWFKAAKFYGWDIGTPALAFERLCAARNAEIARLNGIYLQMLERAGVRLFPDHARLLPDRTGNDTLSGDEAEAYNDSEVLDGGTWNDRLLGNGGNDHVTGGIGLDEFNCY